MKPSRFRYLSEGESSRVRRRIAGIAIERLGRRSQVGASWIGRLPINWRRSNFRRMRPRRYEIELGDVLLATVASVNRESAVAELTLPGAATPRSALDCSG